MNIIAATSKVVVAAATEEELVVHGMASRLTTLSPQVLVVHHQIIPCHLSTVLSNPIFSQLS